MGNLGQSNLRRALETFRRLPELERKPHVAAEPDPEMGLASLRSPVGGLVARAYMTALERDAAGELTRAARVYTDCHVTSAGCVEPALTQVDMLWMTVDEWRSLLPPEPSKGVSFRVPEILERRMISQTIPCSNPIGDRGELTLTVTEVSAEGVSLRLDGWSKQGPSFKESTEALLEGGEAGKPRTPATAIGQAGRWLGHLKYDVRQKAITRFDILVIGDAWGEGFNRKYGTGSGAELVRWPIGYAFELAGKGTADRITPPVTVQSSLYNSGLSKLYWGK